jgi:hypothetical protein
MKRIFFVIIYFVSFLLGEGREPVLVYKKPCTNYKRVAYQLPNYKYEIVEQIGTIITAKWYGSYSNLDLAKLSSQPKFSTWYSSNNDWNYFDSLKLWDRKGEQQLEIHRFKPDESRSNYQVRMYGYQKGKKLYMAVFNNVRVIIGKYKAYHEEVVKGLKHHHIPMGLGSYLVSLTYYDKEIKYVTYEKEVENRIGNTHLFIQKFWGKNGEQLQRNNIFTDFYQLYWRHDSLILENGRRGKNKDSKLDASYNARFPNGELQYEWEAKGESVVFKEYYSNGVLKHFKNIRMLEGRSPEYNKYSYKLQKKDNGFYSPYLLSKHMVVDEELFDTLGEKLFAYNQEVKDDLLKFHFAGKINSVEQSQTLTIPSYLISLDNIFKQNDTAIKQDSFHFHIKHGKNDYQGWNNKQEILAIYKNYFNNLDFTQLMNNDYGLKDYYKEIQNNDGMTIIKAIPVFKNKKSYFDRYDTFQLISQPKRNRYRNGPNSDLSNDYYELVNLNIKVKKDFDACLYGLWSEDKNMYVVKPEYSFISKANANDYYGRQVYFKASKDNNEFVVINGNGKVVYKQKGDFYFKWQNSRYNKPSYYQIRAHRDSAMIYYTRAFREIGRFNNVQKISELRNDAMQFTFRDGSNMIYYVNWKQKAVKEYYPGSLMNLNRDVYIAGNQLCVFDTNGVIPFYTAASEIKKIGNRVWAYADQTNLIVLKSDWSEIKKYTIEMDTPQGFLDFLVNEGKKSYYYQKKNKKYYYVYSKNKKYGALDLRLNALLSPIYDVVRNDYFAVRGTKKYLFSSNGDTVAFPYRFISSGEFYNYEYKLYKDKNEFKLSYDNSWFPIRMKDIFEFIPIGQVKNRYQNIQLILGDDDQYYYYYHRGFALLSTELNGSIKSLINRKQYLFLDNKIVGRAYDTIYSQTTLGTINQMINSYYPGLRAYSSDSLFILQQNGTKEVYQNNTPGSKEYLVNEEVYGYTKNYEHYYNNCGGIFKLPNGVWQFKSYQKQAFPYLALHFSTEREVVKTLDINKESYFNRYKNPNKYNNWQDRYNSRSYNDFNDYYLYNKESNKTSKHPFNGELKSFDGHLQLKIGWAKYKLIDQDFKEVLPIASYSSIVKRYDNYYIKNKDLSYRYQLSTKRFDTLGRNVSYWDSLHYAISKDEKVILYNYDGAVLYDFSTYGINEMHKWEWMLKDTCQSCNYTWNGASSRSKSAYNKLTKFQQQFLFALSLKGDFSYQPIQAKPEYVKSKVYPDYKYFHERLDGYMNKIPDIKSEHSFEEGEEYEMFDAVMVDDGGPISRSIRSGFNKQTNENLDSLYSEKYKEPFQKELERMSLRSREVNFLSNGLVILEHQNYRIYTPSIILELKDSAYQLLSFMDIVDEDKKDSLLKLLKHKISLKPEYWGITCQADLDQFSFIEFAEMFHLNSVSFTFRKPNKSTYISIYYKDLVNFIKPQYQTYFRKK